MFAKNRNGRIVGAKKAGRANVTGVGGRKVNLLFGHTCRAAVSKRSGMNRPVPPRREAKIKGSFNIAHHF